jgi:hypothetical protein
MLDPKLARQSLARELTAWERDFAAALETAFAAGHHAPDAIALAFTTSGFAHVDGSRGSWTPDEVQAALVALNADLDAAYSDCGIGV